MRVKLPASGRLVSISKPVKPTSARGSMRQLSIREMGGASVRNAVRKPSGAAPSSSITTPPAVLDTRPRTPSRSASLLTNGRKPTPCTMPVRVIRYRKYRF